MVASGTVKQSLNLARGGLPTKTSVFMPLGGM